MADLTSNDVTQRLGALSDHTVAEILDSGVQLRDLEIVAIRLAQEDDVLGDARKSLSGLAAEVFDIVMRDPLYTEEDERFSKGP